jgi:prolyl oligopeptidase
VDISCPDWRANLCHVTITSWTLPPTRYDYDANRETFQISKFHVDGNYPGIGDVVAEEVDVPGHDGVMIRLTIIYRKGISRDGSNGCILNGYGAYGMSATPSFSTRRDALALHDIVMAESHLRAGGERGEAWHNAGRKTTKPNTWKDFI